VPLAPVVVTVAVPFEFPKQDTSLVVNDNDMLQPGEPTVTLAVAVHPCESVTVTEYDPADKPLTVCVD
jgi:hypothetical protein